MSKRQENIGVLVPKTYKHDLSHSHTTTLDWFRLQPLACVEMIENDKFSVNLSTLLEAAPLATKVYGGAYLDIHAFFVPKRILWKDWNNYRYGNTRDSSTSYVLPHLSLSSLHAEMQGGSCVAVNGDYVYREPSNDVNASNKRRVFGALGYPTSAILNFSEDPNILVNDLVNQLPISAMESRAFQRVWWDWYRDSVHIEESNAPAYLYTQGGGIGLEERRVNFTPRYRCWRKDYITTLLSSPQMGDGAVAQGSVTKGAYETTSGQNSSVLYFDGTDGTAQGFFVGQTASAGQSTRQSLVPTISAYAMRGAIAMQRFLEKLNVTGTRPIERIQSLFGSAPNPVRLDMSEFIGSYRQRVSVSGLTNTGSQQYLGETGSNAFGIDDSRSHFGVQQGRSYGEGQTPSFNYSATEDGYFMVIASLMPEYVNPTAMNRQFIRGLATPDSDRFDFYTSEFDGIGFQECLYSEVALPEYTESTGGTWGVGYDPFAVAGYQPKYEDYRFIQDRLSGDFNEPQSSVAMRNMVYTRNFQDGRPSGELPQSVELTTPQETDRASFDNHFCVTDSSVDHFILNAYINIDAVRPISKAELPMELSNLANSDLTSVANGGLRL